MRLFPSLHDSLFNFYFFKFIFIFLAVSYGMQDLSSLTRDQTHTPSSGSTES